MADTGHLIRDPRLTDKGILQCAKLSHHLKNIEKLKVDTIFCSPLKRTIETTLLSFNYQWLGDLGFEINNDSIPSIILQPDLQELPTHPADTGREWEELKKDFKSNEISLMDPSLIIENNLWFDKTKQFEKIGQQLIEMKKNKTNKHKNEMIIKDMAGKERWDDFVLYLQKYCQNKYANINKTNDINIAVVAHHGPYRVGLKQHFQNCETRKYQFNLKTLQFKYIHGYTV